MDLAIMQPYFFPYIGYFQLIGAVDLFIVYDNIKYTKKGWINRNRLLSNGQAAVFSLPLKRDSDYLDVCDRELAQDFDPAKLLNQIAGAYRHAPYLPQTLPLIDRIVHQKERNLFRFLHGSIVMTCDHLGVTTAIRPSSEVSIDDRLKSQDKVIALAQAVGATRYINAIGGTELYSKDEFRAKGIELRFLKPLPFEYSQLDREFVPWLSIIDIMMFNSVDTIRRQIASGYELI